MGDHVKVSRVIQRKESPIYSVGSLSEEDESEMTLYNHITGHKLPR
jgi:hypothetical protein